MESSTRFVASAFVYGPMHGLGRHGVTYVHHHVDVLPSVPCHGETRGGEEVAGGARDDGFEAGACGDVGPSVGLFKSCWSPR
jgi:hypothetical protein